MNDNSKSNRREFLKGKSAVDAIRTNAELLSPQIPAGLDAATALRHQTAYLEQYSRNAMACEFELSFNMHQNAHAGAVALRAFELIETLENQMSVYRDHSEISQLNRVAGREPFVVEAQLYSLLKLAKDIHTQTNQAFDITAGALSKIWGFDKRNGAMPENSVIEKTLDSIGTNDIRFNDQENSVSFGNPGLSINLGGIGKGYSLDRVADFIESMNIHDFIIHGGQSSVLARGSSATPQPQRSTEHPATAESINEWTVGISHPTLPGVRLAELVLRNRSLGTSGTGRQGFFHNGKRYGHIIDPRTGWPSSHFLSTTVISDSAAISDALATAFFVMSPDDVETYCGNHPKISAVLVIAAPKQKSQIELVTFNLSDDDWRRLY